MVKFASERIGILGGTFNPVHNGHLYLARKALTKLRLSKIIFVPTFIPPHKKIYGKISANDRIHMLRLAISGKKKFAVSLYEIKKKGRSYSIKTARFFRKKYGKKSKLFFLIGADSMKSLARWKNIAGLRKLLRFVVVPRPGFCIRPVFPGIITINIPKRAVSSTKIRRLAHGNASIERLVPKKVCSYIKEKKLYR